MTTDQKKKYEEAALTHTRITFYSSDFDAFDAFMAGAEHAHPIAHSEGWNDAIDSVISMIKVGPDQVYIHSGKIYDELKKLKR